MNNTNTQPEAGTQEAGSIPVANNLGRVDEHSLADFVKSNFLNEEEAAPAKEEQAETKAEVEGNKKLLQKYQYDELPWIRKIFHLGKYDPFDRIEK